MLRGVQVGVDVISACRVVMPLFEAGGTRLNGLFVMLYVTSPIVMDVVVKLTTPVPELLAEKTPLKEDENESLPAIGAVWVTVSVNVPEILMTPFPDTKV
jgi:hypothetical protein